jgi:ABC-type transport system involved in cytochrome c biogenesis permease component
LSALGRHMDLSLRLYFRNRMALLYGYLFPVIFLIAFWVLYRYEPVPLIAHVGELLTVTILGGACFGLPTTLVSERERGVWRRYRLAPVSTSTLLAGTLTARYVAVVGAGIVQLALAMALGMPLPGHLVALFAAFTAVAFAFMGLGLVIAALADTVPAVQALGQCIFLPMLIIGGVAVQLSSLPDWAIHVSAFFPGRYAVQALQSCATGEGLGEAKFSLAALLAIGAAGMITGARLFRWDAEQRFLARGGKGWLVVALGAWLGVGALAEARHLVLPQPPAPEPTQTLSSVASHPVNSRSKFARAVVLTAPPECRFEPKTWREVTPAMVETDVLFDRALPPDLGRVTPIAPTRFQPGEQDAKRVKRFKKALEVWGPAKNRNPLMRTWSLLFIAGEFDVDMLPLERWVPRVVFDRMKRDVPRDRLVKILYWIACHPDALPAPSNDDLRAVDLPGTQGSFAETRHRASLYAIKLLGRLLGKIQ